jgi:hypothetical protein
MRPSSPSRHLPVALLLATAFGPGCTHAPVLRALTGCVTGSTSAEENGSGAACATEALTVVKGTMNLFIDEVDTLNLDQGVDENANAVIDRIEDEVGACAEVTVDHSAEDSSTLTVDFGEGCDVAGTGVYVAGVADVSVGIADGSATLALSAQGLYTYGMTFDGTVSMSTSDLATYRLQTDVDVDTIGIIVFDGTVTPSGASVDTFGATLDGAGTYQSPTEAVAIGNEDVTCTGDGGPLAVTFQGVHRVASACHPDAGVVVGTAGYTCSRTAGGPDAQGSLEATATFDEATASTGIASVSALVDFGASGETPGEETVDVTIPSVRPDCPGYIE